MNVIATVVGLDYVFCFIAEPKDSGLENLISSPSHIKSEEGSSCNQRTSPNSMRSAGGTKRPLKEEDDSTITPSKTVKSEPCDGEEDASAAATSDG